MRFTFGLLCALGLVAAAACGDDDSSGPEPEPQPGAGTVTVGDNFFQPATVTVVREAGSAEVVWNWAGSNQHNVTFDAGPPNSETQTSGSFTRSFPDAGAFTYICTVHGRAVMSGTVNVE
jgi:plastocyanin